MKYYLILSNNERSYEYLKLLIKNKKKPIICVHLDLKNKKIFRSKILNLINKEKINYKSFKSDNIDQKKIISFLLNLKEKIFVYSGYGGKIIKNKHILNKKILLHSHSGKLPEYKGSTTIYYSLIKNKKIYCTTFIMNNEIDKGRILLIKKYKLIKQIKNIDKYDNQIRAENILFTLNNFNQLIKSKRKYANADKNSHYFIIHPILRYIALKN